MLNTFLAEQAQKQARLMQHQVKKNRQTKDVAIQCTRSPRTVEVAVQTDTIEFLSHHSWSSARTLFNEFVSKSIVSAIQYIVVSSAYR